LSYRRRNSRNDFLYPSTCPSPPRGEGIFPLKGEEKIKETIYYTFYVAFISPGSLSVRDIRKENNDSKRHTRNIVL